MENTIQLIAPTELIKESLKTAVSYKTYREMVSEHVQNGTSTGPAQTQDLSQYTLLNDSRMRRLDKTTKIPESVLQKIDNYKGKMTWLVLTESWCGDAAQSMPIMNKMAEMTSRIELKVVLRDENPELMNAFLTNGSKSIPKLIAIDNDTNEIIGDWGPRPTKATQLVDAYKKEHGKLTPEFKKELQVWYNKDKGQNTAENLGEFLD
jgi:thiol-disulfide isomerase/thioredoxin